MQTVCIVYVCLAVLIHIDVWWTVHMSLSSCTSHSANSPTYTRLSVWMKPYRCRPISCESISISIVHYVHRLLDLLSMWPLIKVIYFEFVRTIAIYQKTAPTTLLRYLFIIFPYNSIVKCRFDNKYLKFRRGSASAEKISL